MIESKIQSLGIGSRFKILHDRIITPGDGLIIFQGMQDATAESIKSLERFRIAWIEEAQTLSQRSLSLLRPTIRVLKQLRQIGNVDGDPSCLFPCQKIGRAVLTSNGRPWPAIKAFAGKIESEDSTMVGVPADATPTFQYERVSPMTIRWSARHGARSISPCTSVC